MSDAYATPLPTREASAAPWQTHTVELRDVHHEVEGVSTYNLAFLDDSVRRAYRFAPGQFNMLYLPGAGEIAISISDDPNNTETCRHTIRVAGNVTRTMARLEVGDTLGLRGPFGTSWPLSQCVGRDVVIVCGGIGLAPLRPAICTLLRDRERFGRLHLLYGARTADMLLFANEYKDWSQHGMNVQTTVDRYSTGWSGNVGVVTQLLDQLNSFDPQNTVLIGCGPEVMMKFTVRAALSRGMSEQQIWVSMERNMQCAVGLCGHCQLGPAFICKDGPVFRYDKIAPFIDVEGL